MELTNIFKLEDYSTAYEFLKNNPNYTITEIEKDENDNRQFKFILKSEIEHAEDIKNQNEIENLKSWFTNDYTIHEQKYRRLYTLGLNDDDGLSGYNKLIQLYKDAEIKRARIQELERLLSDSAK